MTDEPKPTRLSRTENATYVIEQLRSLGFDPNPSSRLMQMYRVWERGPHAFGTADFWIALESDRDMVQLGFIFEQLGVHATNPKFLRVVERVLDDSALPQHDRTESKGRNAQFELYLAAVCQKAELVPVDYDEPDVTCTVAGAPFSIAAKRIKNVQKAADRIRKAASQVIESKRPGIIALDISIGFNRNNEPVVSPLHNQMLDTLDEAQGNQFFDKHEALINKCSRGRGILGLALIAFRARIKDGQWCQNRFAMWMELASNEHENCIYREFYDRFSVTIPNRDQAID